jgi:asparagine synthase (glutamine-hydrolysing)
MCGIFGIIDKKKNVDVVIVKLACNKIAHRGPDDEGFFVKENIGLGHRRLSILDLSASGHQPMISADEKHIIIFNGEIYNHNELRENYLKEFQFKSTSDTETLLEGFVKYGEDFIANLNGIFAFAILNLETNSLFIARDHLGVKPLYYYNDDNYFIFSSEIKAFSVIPNLNLKVDKTALFEYLTFLWTPGEKTPYQNVKKLPPASSITIDIINVTKLESISSKQFYEIPINESLSFSSEEQAIDELEIVLLKAVERQLLADVPVGFFLSGGLDSSLLVAMAKKITGNKQLQTFTINAKLNSNEDGFTDDLFYAKKVAAYLDVKLEIVDADVDILKDFDKMIWHLDEPQADPAPLNVLNICKKAKEMGYKVLIGGAGGDDLFSGYRRHQAINAEKYLKYMPSFLGKVLNAIITAIPSKSTSVRRLKKLSDGFGESEEQRVIDYFHWLPTNVVKSLFIPSVETDKFSPDDYMYKLLEKVKNNKNWLNKILFLEQRSFLVDHNLNYTDKMSMAVGVEARVPFLDIELVNFAARLPHTLKMKNNETKYLLKKVAERYLPKEIIYRPKTGFGAPVRKWILNDLELMISERLLKDSNNIFDISKIKLLIEQNKSGKIDASYAIFCLLAIYSWMNQFNHD